MCHVDRFLYRQVELAVCESKVLGHSIATLSSALSIARPRVIGAYPPMTCNGMPNMMSGM